MLTPPPASLTEKSRPTPLPHAGISTSAYQIAGPIARPWPTRADIACLRAAALAPTSMSAFVGKSRMPSASFISNRQ